MDCKCTVIWEYNSLSDDLGFRIGRTSTSYENPILNGCVEKMVMNKAEILKNIVRIIENRNIVISTKEAEILILV